MINYHENVAIFIRQKLMFTLIRFVLQSRLWIANDIFFKEEMLEIAFDNNPWASFRRKICQL